ncbi:MAG: DUF3853 family protein [Bacteroidales bacterium]|nr:DUF3853 family protein [Bacteroidales bacterium]
MNLEELKIKRVIDMDGNDIISLLDAVLLSRTANQEPTLAKGQRELAKALYCGITLICKMQVAGVLNPAIVSKIGRSFVYDVDKAREVAKMYTLQRNEDEDDFF